MATVNLDFNNTNIFDRTADTKSYQYRDIGTKNFLTIKDKNNNIESVKISNTSLYNDDAVKNAINNIFAFIPGNEILDPEFGNSLYRYLYQPISQAMSLNIKRDLYSLLETYEPRIIINNIDVNLNADDHFVSFTLYYTIKDSETNSILTINF